MNPNYVGDLMSVVLPQINTFIELGAKGRWESKLHFPVDALVKAFELDGFEVHRDEMDTNGWQWDWWIPVEKGGIRYTLGGCGYNGGISLCLED